MSEMTKTAILEEPLDDERSKVESWRLHVLIEAGYPLSLAERLAVSEADLHLAVRDARQRLRARDGRRDPALVNGRRATTLAPVTKVAPLRTTTAPSTRSPRFNRGVAQWLSKLPTLWVEGEVTELRRHERWASVFFTLKDPADGSSLGVTMQRGRFDALRLDLEDGERVHVFGRPELYEQRGEFSCARSRSSASASARTSPRSSA